MRIGEMTEQDLPAFMVVEDVIVDREQRRRGIGSVLMRAIEEQAVSRNCSYIMFVTDSTRVDAPGVLATDLFVLLNSLLPVERVPYRNNLVLYSEPGLSDVILTESSLLFRRTKSEAIK
jgi:GNAT superfamily N-acetyltransferase